MFGESLEVDPGLSDENPYVGVSKPFVWVLIKFLPTFGLNKNYIEFHKLNGGTNKKDYQVFKLMGCELRYNEYNTFTIITWCCKLSFVKKNGNLYFSDVGEFNVKRSKNSLFFLWNPDNPIPPQTVLVMWVTWQGHSWMKEDLSGSWLLRWTPFLLFPTTPPSQEMKRILIFMSDIYQQPSPRPCSCRGTVYHWCVRTQQPHYRPQVLPRNSPGRGSLQQTWSERTLPFPWSEPLICRSRPLWNSFLVRYFYICIWRS